MQTTLRKKWIFPLRISSVNVTKSAGNFIFCAMQFIYYCTIHELINQFWHYHQQDVAACFKKVIHCNFFIVFPIWLKIFRSNIFFFLKWQNSYARKTLKQDRARSLSRPTRVKVCVSEIFRKRHPRKFMSTKCKSLHSNRIEKVSVCESFLPLKGKRWA